MWLQCPTQAEISDLYDNAIFLRILENLPIFIFFQMFERFKRLFDLLCAIIGESSFISMLKRCYMYKQLKHGKKILMC